MLSSALPVTSGSAISAADDGSLRRGDEASSEADESGTGDAGGAEAASSLTASGDDVVEEAEGATGAAAAGAGAGAGSLTTGELTDVSPVNGFLYSLCGFSTSRALGL